jgi:hypothetical protein
VILGKGDESGVTRKQALQNEQGSDAGKLRNLMKGRCKATGRNNMILQWVTLVHWRRMKLNKTGK